MRRVYLENQDITDKVIEIPDVSLKMPDFLTIGLNEISSIRGSNTSGFWSINSNLSPFYGQDLRDFELYIYDTVSASKVFEGYILDIEVNEDTKTAEIKLESYLNKSLGKGCIYASSDISDPATIIQEIFELYKLKYDSDSIGYCKSIFNTNSVQASASFIELGHSVLEALQQVCSIGNLRIYSQNNKLYTDIMRIPNLIPIKTFSSELLSHPVIHQLEKDQVKGYNIKYVGGSAIWGNSDNQGKSLTADYTAPVRLHTLQSAVWVGEQYVNYVNSIQYQIEVDIPLSYGRYLELNYPIAIQYENYLTRTYLVTSIERNSLLKSRIGGTSI